MLLDKIETLIFSLDGKVVRNRQDKCLLLAFQNGRDKMIKHYKQCNWMYIISLILDPRHKIITFDQTEWGRNLKMEAKRRFKQIFKEKYCVQQENINIIKQKVSEEEDFLNFSSIYSVTDKSGTDWENELREHTEALRAPADTDILLWWEKHAICIHAYRK